MFTKNGRLAMKVLGDDDKTIKDKQKVLGGLALNMSEEMRILARELEMVREHVGWLGHNDNIPPNTDTI